MRNAPIHGATQVNQYIKGLLDRDGVLAGLFVWGELSNYKAHPSGHHYFFLKDVEGAIRCVMFRWEAMGLRFRPEGGIRVVALGRVTVFLRDGQYQLCYSELTPDGAGDFRVAFGQLKQELYQEGLFDPTHKKPIPCYPRKITLITSPAGAAVRDTLHTLRTCWSLAEVLVLPMWVQGAEAPEELCVATAWVNRHRMVDLLITGWGGDSMEDLWAFNDENVARTIYVSETPVISAVGHEPDVTIVDFVADLRTATPSNAVELAVLDQSERYGWLEQMGGYPAGAMGRWLERTRCEPEQVGRCRVLQDLTNYVNDRRTLLDYQRGRLAHGLTRAMGRERERFVRLAVALDAPSLSKALGRGYTTPRRPDGVVLRSAKEVMLGETLLLCTADGKVSCKVIEAAGQGKDEIDGGKESNL